MSSGLEAVVLTIVGTPITRWLYRLIIRRGVARACLHLFPRSARETLGRERVLSGRAWGRIGFGVFVMVCLLVLWGRYAPTPPSDCQTSHCMPQRAGSAALSKP